MLHCKAIGWARAKGVSGVSRVGPWKAALMVSMLGLTSSGLQAQVPPTAAEAAGYRGLFASAYAGDEKEASRLIDRGADLRATDGHGRTALHVAAHRGHYAMALLLLSRGADPNALDRQRYDVLTIAAVRNDAEMARIALAAGADPGLVTSPYDGTALIAAAHLGHWPVIAELIAAGAPLDHVNSLGWTALIEAVILGDGGPDHVESLRLLVEAGADVDLADRAGLTPLAMARARGYHAMVRVLEDAGAK